MDFVDVIRLKTSDGDVFLDVSSKFMDMVRQENNLSLDAPVSEEHVKSFLVSAMRNALEHEDEKSSD